MIKATPAGEEITICMFKFNDQELADLLIAAEKRGVGVSIILNNGETSDQDNKEIKKFFHKELKDFFYIENTVSKKGILHNKFVLFSSIETLNGPIDHVVLQTSSNFVKKSAKRLQDMIIFQDKDTYQGYLDYWYNIKVLGELGKLESYNYFSVKGQDKKTYFFPKRKEEEKHGKDNLVKILNDIEDPTQCVIRIAHGKWDEKRKKVIEKLNSLKNQGARIEIVTNADQKEELIKSFDQLDVDLVLFDKKVHMHTKFLLIEAPFSDGSTLKVLTGSHNLTERSLRNNFEVLLELRDEKIYQIYLRYFNQIDSLD